MATRSSSEKPAVLIKASAGSGKTYRLTRRILSLVLSGIPPQTILATTFTRKASAEITSRLYETIASTYLREISSTEKPNSYLETLLAEDIQGAYVFRVATIDSLCLSLAQVFSYELGFPSNLAPASFWRQEEVQAQAISKLLEKTGHDVTRSLLQELTLQQSGRSVYQVLERYLNEAYALFLQAGKQGILEIPRCVEPPRFQELTEDLELLLTSELPRTQKGEPDKRWHTAISKCHSFLKERSWLDFLGSTICQACLSGEQFSRRDFPAELEACLRRLIKQSLAFVEHESYLQTRALSALFDLYATAKEELAEKYGVYSFDDIKAQIATTSLLAETGIISYRLDSTYAHLLFDEFQDTSLLDWSVLRSLADEVLSGISDGRTFFCVGDVKQSIYQWRGGLPALFSSLEEDYNHVLETESLDFSFRCSQKVLDFVNEFFRLLPSTNAKEPLHKASLNWKSRFAPHTAKQEHEGFVHYRKVLTTSNPQESSEELLIATSQTVALLAHSYPHASIGVLLRDNSSIQPILSSLRCAPFSLEVSEEGASALKDSPLIQAFFALFQLLDHPDDSVALFHLTHTPLGNSIGISPAPSQTSVASELSKLRQEVSAKGLGHTLNRLGRNLRPFFTSEEQIRFEQLIEFAYVFDKEFEERFTDFSRYVSGETVEHATDARVRVMTVHKSKGLEFDFVVLPSLDKPFKRRGKRDSFLKKVDSKTGQVVGARILPPKALRPMLNDSELEDHLFQQEVRQLEEEMSILYVAFTRARYGLSILGHSERDTSKGLGLAPTDIIAEALSNLCEKEGEGYFYGTTDLGPATIFPKSPNAEVRTVTPTIINVSKRELLPVLRSPSSLNRQGSQEGHDLFSREARSWQALGEQVHSLLEKVGWEDSLETALSLMQETPHSDLDNRAREIVTKAFTHTDFKELFRPETFGPKSALHLWRERRFAVPWQGVVLTGTFDRVVLLGEEGDEFLEGPIERCWIVDFKTTSGGDEPSHVVQQYRPQLEMYAQALQRLLGFDYPVEINLFLALLPLGTVLKL